MINDYTKTLFSVIVTHDTQFHADDVIAAALLLRLNPAAAIIRTRDKAIIETAQNDIEYCVFDVGFKYEPAANNFDHHQDLSLPSAAGLVWNAYGHFILPNPLENKFFAEFIASIDAIDTNRDNIYAVWNTLPSGFRNTSSILGGFNRDARNAELQDSQFRKAVMFANEIIENELISAQTKAESEVNYQNRRILENNVAVFETFSTVWKDKHEHMFAVLPHANGWQVQSADTATTVVPETANQYASFIFRHASGFMCVFAEKQDALDFAATLEEFRNEY